MKQTFRIKSEKQNIIIGENSKKKSDEILKKN